MTTRQLASKAAMAAVIVGLTAIPSIAGPLTVTVVAENTDAPLAKAAVAVVSSQKVVAAGKTSAQGIWNGTIPDGKVTVLAAKDLYVTATKTVTVSGKTALQLELSQHTQEDFQRLGRIVGFARSNGQPLGNATLVLFKGKSPVGAAQPENSTGVYELEWYAPGTYRVLATAPGHQSAQYAGQKIAAGESLWLDVTLKKK